MGGGWGDGGGLVVLVVDVGVVVCVIGLVICVEVEDVYFIVYVGI